MNPSQWEAGGGAERLEVRHDAGLREDFLQPPTPDDQAFSVAVFLDGSTIARPPYLCGELCHLLIAPRIVREAGGFGGTRANERRARLDVVEVGNDHGLRREGRAGVAELAR